MDDKVIEMSKTTRSIDEVDAVRERILDCAFNILAKSGYEYLSMSKIGSRMKMTAANLYNYFGNKDELLIAIHKKAHVMLYDKLRTAIKKADSPLRRYKKLTYAFVDFGTENIHLYDIMFNRPIRQHRDYIGTPQEQLSAEEYHSSLRVLTLTVKTIAECRKANPNLATIDPKLLAVQCFSALHGVISLYNSGVLSEITDDADRVLKEFTENVFRFVAG
ncbi:MAG: TetR/AcrR family transcriptional regulator [Thermodesulfobacteriota bacterium]